MTSPLRRKLYSMPILRLRMAAAVALCLASALAPASAQSVDAQFRNWLDSD